MGRATPLRLGSPSFGLVLLSSFLLLTLSAHATPNRFPRLLDYFVPYLDDWEIATSLLEGKPEEGKAIFAELYERTDREGAHLVLAELDLLGRVMVAAELMGKGEIPPAKLFAYPLKGDLTNSLGLVEVEVLVVEGDQRRYEKRLVSLARCWRELDRFRDRLGQALIGRTMPQAALAMLELIASPPGFPELRGELVEEMGEGGEEELWLRKLFAPLREPLLLISVRLSSELSKQEEVDDQTRQLLSRFAELSLKQARRSAIPLASLTPPEGG